MPNEPTITYPVSLDFAGINSEIKNLQNYINKNVLSIKIEFDKNSIDDINKIVPKSLNTILNIKIQEDSSSFNSLLSSSNLILDTYDLSKNLFKGSGRTLISWFFFYMPLGSLAVMRTSHVWQGLP